MIKRTFSFLMAVTFVFTTISPVRADIISQLPPPGNMVSLSSSFEPVLIKGLKVNPTNPLEFDFIVDTGNTTLKADDLALKEEGKKLIKYFLTALTVPEKDLWVNLSPYEKNRIIANNLGQTQMGQDMLAQDYILKQLAASLSYPEQGLGKEFWQEIYKQAKEKYGSSNIPLNAFDKVWIVADSADVFERNNVAFITGAHLKVMMEEDYIAREKHEHTKLATLSTKIMKEIIVPAIQKEVNEGKNFTALRQIYYSMVLASWYKTRLKDAFITQMYANKSKVNAGVNSLNPKEKEAIFDLYLKAYKKGVFNFIKEETTLDNKAVARKYFSGGLSIEASRVTKIHQSFRPADNLGTGRLVSMAGAAVFISPSNGRSDTTMTAIEPLTYFDYATAYNEVIYPAYKEDRLRAPNKDPKTMLLMNRVKDYFLEKNRTEDADLIDDTQFRFLMPKDNARLDDSLFYIRWFSSSKFLITQALNLNGEEIVVVPYVLAVTQLTQNAPIEAIAEILLEEAKRAAQIYSSGHAETTSGAYHAFLERTMPRLLPYMNFSFNSEEILGPLYAINLIKQPQVAGRIAAVNKGDIPVLSDLTASDRRSKQDIGIAEIKKGRFAEVLMAGGAGSRMVLSNPPQELDSQIQAEAIPGTEYDRLLGKKKIPDQSKGLTPFKVGNTWYNYIGLHVLNHIKLGEALGITPGQMPFVFGTGSKTGNHVPQSRYLDEVGLTENVALTHYWKRDDYLPNPGKRVVPPLAEVEKNKSLLKKAFTNPTTGEVDEKGLEKAFHRSQLMAQRQAGEVIKVMSKKTSLVKVIPAPRGHGGQLHNLFATGLILELIRPTQERPEGVNYIGFRNVDNFSALLNSDQLVILGTMIKERYGAMLEVSRRPKGQKGGTLIKELDSEGRLVNLQIAEDPSLKGTPVDSTRADYINNATGIFALDEYLFPLYGTTRSELLEIDKITDPKEQMRRLKKIAENGAKQFPLTPVTRAERDTNGDYVLGTIFETNMWESTGPAVRKGLKVGAIEVGSIESVRDKVKDEMGGLDKFNTTVLEFAKTNKAKYKELAEATDERVSVILTENEEFRKDVEEEVMMAYLAQNADFKESLMSLFHGIRFSPNKSWADYLGINNFLLPTIVDQITTKGKLVDTASFGSEIQGGIDLKEAKINVSKEGEGIRMHFDTALMARIKQEGYEGVEFNIQSVTLITDLKAVLM